MSVLHCRHLSLNQVAKLGSLGEHGSLRYEEPMERILELLPSKLHIRLQTSPIVMPPIASSLLKLVRGKVHLLIIIALDKSELLLHGLQPLISCHRVLNSRKDEWVGLHKTVIPMKQCG